MPAWKAQRSLALFFLASALMFAAVPPMSSQTTHATERINARPASETTDLEFEAASVRPTDLYSDTKSFGMDDPAGAPRSGLFSSNTFLLNYIRFAYHYPSSDVQEESLYKRLEAAGLNHVKWDIEARAEGIPTREQMRQMVQSLLEDRFKLRIHYETRQGPIYALVLDAPGILGPQLHAHPKDAPCVKPGSESAQTLSQGNGPFCGGVAVERDQNYLLHLTMAAVPISQLVDTLDPIGKVNGGLFDLPIVDETGLKGEYDIHFQFALSPPASRPDMEVPGPGSPTLAEALKKQLGLRLVKTSGPVKFLVIDHVEKPSPN